MKIYRYLYYKLFCIWLKKRDEPENAHINAIISISFLVCINIISIPLILMAVFGTDTISFPEIKQSPEVPGFVYRSARPASISFTA